jgi:hypothetical protein
MSDLLAKKQSVQLNQISLPGNPYLPNLFVLVPLRLDQSNACFSGSAVVVRKQRVDDELPVEPDFVQFRSLPHRHRIAQGRQQFPLCQRNRF